MFVVPLYDRDAYKNHGDQGKRGNLLRKLQWQIKKETRDDLQADNPNNQEIKRNFQPANDLFIKIQHFFHNNLLLTDRTCLHFNSSAVSEPLLVMLCQGTP